MSQSRYGSVLSLLFSCSYQVTHLYFFNLIINVAYLPPIPSLIPIVFHAWCFSYLSLNNGWFFLYSISFLSTSVINCMSCMFWSWWSKDSSISWGAITVWFMTWDDIDIPTVYEWTTDYSIVCLSLHPLRARNKYEICASNSLIARCILPNGDIVKSRHLI